MIMIMTKVENSIKNVNLEKEINFTRINLHRDLEVPAKELTHSFSLLKCSKTKKEQISSKG